MSDPPGLARLDDMEAFSPQSRVLVHFPETDETVSAVTLRFSPSIVNGGAYFIEFNDCGRTQRLWVSAAYVVGAR